jgi:hypothetical protein
MNSTFFQDFDWLQALLFAIGGSVWWVWAFRFENVEKEFRLFGLSDQTKALVGSSKVSLATLLIASIWFPALTVASAALMAFFLAAAQFFHWRHHSPAFKRIPSLVLFAACVVIVLSKSRGSFV